MAGNNPKLLIGIETLLPGGAETFVIRLSNALSSKFEVTLFVVCGQKVDSRLLNGQTDKFRLKGCTFPFEFFLRKMDGLLLRIGIDFSVRDWLVIRRLRNIVKRERFTILHSNQYKVDYLVFQANKTLHITHLTTIHGDYLNFWQQSKRGTLRILNFESKAVELLSHIGGIVYISDHQLNFFISEWKLFFTDRRVVKIYNGIELTLSDSDSTASPDFKKEEFVFGMVARGIREKGWEIAIKSFISVYTPGAQLVLVGNGEYLDYLKSIYQHPAIYFVGYSADPIEWIRLFDVGLLPSTFASESLPTSIIEYLMMGKPVIASDKGEIRNMLEREDGCSGIVLEVHENAIVQSDLIRAMESLMHSPELRRKMAVCATRHAAAFSLQECVDSYLSFYRLLTTKD